MHIYLFSDLVGKGTFVPCVALLVDIGSGLTYGTLAGAGGLIENHVHIPLFKVPSAKGREDVKG
jgi:hypothetical protein